MCRLTLLPLLCFIFSFSPSDAQRLKVSENNRYLVTENNEPFFWLADTAWELFHRCTMEDIRKYLVKRKEQGFNVIQAVALAEIDGLHTPNKNGDLPLINDDPTRPNEPYFKFIEQVIDLADSMGIYIALLPTWGDKVFKNNWGTGPEIFNPENASAYGQWIGERFKEKDNLIWVIGGDRNPRVNSNDVAIWNAMAEGIAKSAGGYDQTLMTFHPQPNSPGGSSTWFHDEEWLDFNMHQTGHCPDKHDFKKIYHDYSLDPVKPVLDGEPLYEDIPICFKVNENGYSMASDIRNIMYRNVFAGAMGQTYGCNDVWQMYSPDKTPSANATRPWYLALDMPMANQMIHLKTLMLSRPYLSRIPDTTLVKNSTNETSHKIATRDQNGLYAMIYFPVGQSALLNLSELTGNEFSSTWYDPRTGSRFSGPDLEKERIEKITPPSNGPGNDWVLIIDAIKAQE